MDRYRTTWGSACQIVMLIGVSLLACRSSDAGQDLVAYYYPIDDLPSEGLVYRYSSLVDSLPGEETWRLTRSAEGNLVSENIDPDGRILLRQVDRRVASGILTDSLTLFPPQPAGTSVPVTIHAGNRFSFDRSDSTATFLTHLEWWQPGDSLHIVLQRRRQLAGDTTWTWQGKSRPAVIWRTDDQLETERDGWTNSGWLGKEVYARGIGLVYYERQVNTGFNLKYALRQIE